MRDQLRRLSQAFSSPDPAPVLAGVKVARPVGRSTLTPAAAGVTGHHKKAGVSPPLDTARPHGCT